MQIVHYADAVGRVVIGGKLAKPQHGAVVLSDFDELARSVVRGDFLAPLDRMIRAN